MNDALIGCKMGINFGPESDIRLNARINGKGIGFCPDIRPAKDACQNSCQEKKREDLLPF
jgi:hypothetical protein